MDTITKSVADITLHAKLASKTLRSTNTECKNNALINISQAIKTHSNDILKANKKDLENARKNKLSASLLERLSLDQTRISSIITSLEQIISLPDPVGEISNLHYRPSGIQVGRMRTPLGVIAIIYESRPNVTIDAAALCLKSGNAAILKGGSEAIYSNLALYKCIRTGLIAAGLNEKSIQLIDITSRKVVSELIKHHKFVDVIIPRGGRELIENINAHSKIPVIKHLDGICHIYIDKLANREKAIQIAFNAKTRRYGVCNAMETLLVHADVAQDVLPDLAQKFQEKNVELRGCMRTQKIISNITAATEKDWHTEYLAPILSIRIVQTMEEAIAHIDTYGSGHTEVIITENYKRARSFLTEVDSSSVMVNASSSFADGFEYGLGAEIGISTDKLHVRGPVGLEGLTSKKYVILGDGHIRP